jgi:uncharacterized protein (TIGR04551 family)
VKRALLILVLLCLTRPAAATGLTDYGRDLRGKPSKWFEADGYMRMRGALLNNLDLDRGATPSGQLLFPVRIDDPSAQTLTQADMRLRADLAGYWPEGGVAVKVRLDALDNLALGSAPEGIPSASTSQGTADATVIIRRAYGEVLTPFGLLAAGRMGNHWGLGMLANGGDCDVCDSGDSADRIAFITPLLGHVWAVAYDFSATGPFLPNRSRTLAIDVAPSANVHTITTAVARIKSDATRRRRRGAGKWTPEYGAYVSHRWQNRDVPATYLPTAQPLPISPAGVTARGYTATAADLWLKFSGPGVNLELEAAYLRANVEQASLIPGVSFREPVTSNQIGVAFESDFGDFDGWGWVGLDAGVASGDDAPGFGAFPEVGAASPVRGDIDGAQARPPFDNSVDNFRFHPDFRIDQILFRQIIGTITDAGYLRPNADLTLYRSHQGRISFGLAAIFSWAMSPGSTPSGKRLLGLELDPAFRYDSPFGFSAALEQATLIPFSGLDNVELGLDAKVAQSWRARLMYRF